MTDWKSIAAARGIPSTPESREAHAAALTELEALMAAAKKGLPVDTEPAAVFVPFAGRGEGR